MSLQNAMDQARQAASNLPATQDNTTGTDVSVQTYGTSLDDFLSGGMQVDRWLQVKDVGMRLDRDEKLALEEFECVLDVNSIQLFTGIRAEFAGNKVEYAKSFDGGRTSSRGENFAAIVAHYKANSLKPADTYRGADMALILDSDVKQGKSVIASGTKVGYTTPITGFTPFQTLLKQLSAEGIVRDAGGGRLAGDRNVRVKLTHETRTNTANQDYGVVHFEFLGFAD